SPAGRETVLVVEDEEVVRELVRQVLKESGYTVLAASDGEEAIEVATASKVPVHLVVMDVIMPKMGGREAARSLERLFPGVSILYMSGYTDEAIVHHGVLESGISFLEKPFTPDALLRKVREVLNLRTKGQSRGLP
ncbi:MAG: response regulator, partial [Candidatus Deferrimicrobiota bacterium]